MTAGHTETRLAYYGMRRADGQPWRTEPRHDGDTAYYARGEEVTDDALVFLCWDLLELLTCVTAQRDTDDTPHPGDVIPVRARYQHSPDGWHYVYEDMPADEYAVHVHGLAAIGQRIERQHAEHEARANLARAAETACDRGPCALERGHPGACRC